MFKKRGILIISMLIICSMFFAACGSKKNETATNNQKNIQEKKVEKKKQVLSIPLDAEPDSLDLAKVSDTYSYAVVSQAIEGLTCIVVRDGKEVVEPGLAKTWDISNDELTWTFHLRDAKWSDGKEVTAQDFVYGITRILDPKTASPISSSIKFIKNASDIIEKKKPVSEAGIKAINEKTLEIKLEYPVPYFLESAGGTSMLPVRRDIVEKYGDSYGTEANKFVCCGPFVLDEWVHNSSLGFSKNPTYWNAKEVKLQKLNMKIISEEKAAIGEFENGGLDFISTYSAEWIKKLDQNSNYIKTKVDIPRTQYIFFNQKIKLFSNKKVRQAFSIALDREEIKEHISKGIEEAAYGWIPPSMGVDGKNFRKLAGNPIKNMIKANSNPKALLIEGLKELGMSEDPSQVTIQLMCKNTSKEFAEYLQQHYKNTLGVNIKIDPVEWPVFQERNRGLDYEMGYKSYGADFNDPSAMMNLWITGTKTVPTAWSNADYDRLMFEAEKSIDKKLRAKNFVEAEKIVLEEGTIIPYAYSSYFTYTHKYVKNVMEPSFASPIYKYVYIEK